MKLLLRYIRVVILHLLYRCRPSLPISDNTVIIAPHPDDEVIGCAGLIHTLVNRGTPPHIIILTGGEGAHRGCCDTSGAEVIIERRKLTMTAANELGLPVSQIHFLDYPDENISQDSSETEKLKELLNRLSPQTVFVPHRGEGWSDHVKAAEIVRQLMKSNDISIYEYCVWMWYYNVWNLDSKNAYILKMSHPMHQRKLQAIDQYTTPLAPCGRPWSGELPKVFLKAARWNKELYFKVR